MDDLLTRLMQPIPHNQGPCPVIGEHVQVWYNDGQTEMGIAQDTYHWQYVERYRLIDGKYEPRYVRP